jgi:hypothetical protein
MLGKSHAQVRYNSNEANHDIKAFRSSSTPAYSHPSQTPYTLVLRLNPTANHGNYWGSLGFRRAGRSEQSPSLYSLFIKTPSLCTCTQAIGLTTKRCVHKYTLFFSPPPQHTDPAPCSLLAPAVYAARAHHVHAVPV